MAFSHKSYSRVAAKVAQTKAEHPEYFCPEPHCLWRTGDGSRCPRHILKCKSCGAEITAHAYCCACVNLYGLAVEGGLRVEKVKP